MPILKLCVGRKREAIHDLSCSSSSASQVSAGVTSSRIAYLLYSCLVPGEALPSPHFIMKQYHKSIPKPVSVDTSYVFSQSHVSWDTENLLPCCLWQGEYVQICCRVSLSLVIPNLFYTRDQLCPENWVLLCWTISYPVAFIHLLLKILLASVCRTEVFNTITRRMVETCWNVESFCCIFCADVEKDVVLCMLEIKEIEHWLEEAWGDLVLNTTFAALYIVFLLAVITGIQDHFTRADLQLWRKKVLWILLSGEKDAEKPI